MSLREHLLDLKESDDTVDITTLDSGVPVVGTVVAVESDCIAIQSVHSNRFGFIPLSAITSVFPVAKEVEDIGTAVGGTSTE